MPDWKKAAQSLDLGIPDEQLDAITPTLNAVIGAFRPLPAALTPEDDPAPLFSAFPEDER